MPTFEQYSQKCALVIDDSSEMRAALRMHVFNLGITCIYQTATIQGALDILARNQIELILCDYNLGTSTNGQQFLEYLRSRNLISRSTIFIMVTGEQGYEKVMAAAEMMPDDYLLKPYTTANLGARLDRIMDRKVRLEKVDRLQDARRWSDVVAACDEILADNDKYFVDAQRIKGAALLEMNRYSDAESFYRHALAQRSTSWAKLGLAKALRGKGEVDAAIDTLNDLVREFPTFMVAYDFLGKLLRDRGQGQDALEILNEAARVSPHSLGRQRAISTVAEGLGDYDAVQQAMNAVISQTRDTPLQDAGDFARLGNALVEQGQPEQALSVLSDAQGLFCEDEATALLAAIQCVAHHRTGDTWAAEQAYRQALQVKLEKAPESLLLGIAKAALASGDKTRGVDLLKRVVQNNPDSGFAKDQVSTILHDMGLGAEATQLVETSVKEIIELNNRAVRIGQAGQLGDAATMLCEAADKLPGNLAIVSNAAYVLLADIMQNGYSRDKLSLARRYVQMVYARNAQHPKLAQIADLMRKVQQSYPETAA